MSEPLIEVHHVGKKYAKSLKHAMAYGLTDIARSAFIPRRYRSANFASRLASIEQDAKDAAPVALRKSEFWALEDVNFSLKAGECVGLIGHNGAGKSTLFKILSGIISPSTGSIAIRGRLTSLIEVGSGFHPMLTGRENIYISGAVLGMGKKEIDKKLEEIIAFSGVEEFI
ncbi:MAG: lipopolysaccharide transport system ATP-binding protein, partial [Verrucomicrobiales bacterium]